MNVTLAITTYNRYDLLVQSFWSVLDDPRIDEILIIDDASPDIIYTQVKRLEAVSAKIKVIRQLQNRGMSVNKRDAVFHSKNEWVILFDSDNVIDKNYLDALMNLEGTTNTTPEIIFCPSFARPNFDYRQFGWSVFYAKEAKESIKDDQFNMLMNTCNYVVNREAYLKVWEENKEMKGSDTIWFNYLWLKAGNGFYVVPKMEYEHRVHSGSGFLEDADYNMKKAAEIKKLIELL